AADLRLRLGRDALERAREADHVALAEPLRTRRSLARLLRGRLEVPLDLREERGLRLFVEPPREPPPHRPIFGPVLGLGHELNTGSGHRGHELLDPPIIERIPEARPQRVADQMEPHALVVLAPSPTLHAREERPEELPQQRGLPRLARPEDLLELRPQT